MLLFIYTGDYTVKVLETGGSSNSKGLPDAATAHVLVYAIAAKYEIPELQDLALTKFTSRIPDVAASRFVDVAKVVYTRIQDDDDALRTAISNAALDRIEELAACGTFMDALVHEPKLHGLTARLVPASLRLLQSKCDAATKPLGLKLSEQSAELTKTKQELQDAKKRGHEYTERNVSLRAQIASVEVERKAERRKAAEAERQLKTATDQLAASKISSAGYKKANIQLEAEKVWLKDKVLEARGDTDKERDAHHKTKAELSSATGRLEFWRKKFNKRDKALREIVQISAKWEYCRNADCAQHFSGLLHWDERTTSADAGLMLRCSHCQTTHYGKLVQ